MAFENESNSQRRSIPNQHFVDFRAVNHHHPHLTFISGPQINVRNPRLLPVLPPHLIPVNPVQLARIELERSRSLIKFMNDEGLVPSSEEETKRKTIINELKQIVMKWIKRVGYQRHLSRSCIRDASATILTYGSYGLGVHTSESDIDALCVGPCFANIEEDFFMVLHDMLASMTEISDIHCVKDAKVPLMRFKFDGIAVDLPYAQLQVPSVPENVDILNPFFLKNINESSWRSLSGVRANRSILQLVPNVTIFKAVLRCVKLWAKRRGVYGNLFGFFGGVHLAVLAAFICLRHPYASLAALISIFFHVFVHWEWPTPVILHNGFISSTIRSEIRSFMPIQLPCSPHEFCHSNITRSTFSKIQAEFLRGHYLTKDILKPDFDWSSVFEQFPYSKRYTRFVKICLSASDQEGLGDWVGWVKSRFRCLLLKLEEVQGMCDPNPSEYFDLGVPKPNIVFYWALQNGKGNFTDIHCVEEEFMKNISNGYEGPPGGMTLSIVEASQVPKNVHCNGTKACWRVSEPTDAPASLLFN